MNNNTYPPNQQNPFPPFSGPSGFNFQPQSAFNPSLPPAGSVPHVPGEKPFSAVEPGFPMGAPSVAPSPTQVMSPLPILQQGSADFTTRLVPIADIRFIPEAAHRASICPDRVKLLMKRISTYEHLPPVFLWQSAEGNLVLLDGWHRLEAFRNLGVERVSALVIAEPFGKALARGIGGNTPKNGGLRKGDDAFRALCVMAAALGRTLNPDEANALGLEFTEHEVVSRLVMKACPLPVLSPARLTAEKKLRPRKSTPPPRQRTSRPKRG